MCVCVFIKFLILAFSAARGNTFKTRTVEYNVFQRSFPASERCPLSYKLTPNKDLKC